MPYCKIEVDDRKEELETESLTKCQSVLMQLDGMKFKNIAPEKAEGGFSNCPLIGCFGAIQVIHVLLENPARTCQQTKKANGAERVQT